MNITEEDVTWAVQAYAGHRTGCFMRADGPVATCRCGWEEHSPDPQQAADRHRMRKALEAAAR